MAIEESASSRVQYLARLQQFMDMTLKDLAKASESKDADQREIQAIRGVLLKIVKIWNESTGGTQNNSPVASTDLDGAKKIPSAGTNES